ncbi:hypothetical protein J416_12432 [Gracilibacillus halophilus YIM-C55.5]|uniref:Uncharacterized protein n=2 Tax=Gracilibacillus TaxID=74385 RepID=N4WSJ3_9BACI|nr:hypothetical protein J416_12432 [Gracilibacillus halophilus YIM-C55.5]
MSFSDYWKQIFQKNDELHRLFVDYWYDYSNIFTWQFWTAVILFIGPLIILIFTVDRKRLFEVFLFGYTIHMLWTYADFYLETHNLLIHPYFLSPTLPFGINMTASLLPVSFLLLYQYCTNRGKNFYVYGLLLCFLFGIVFATVSDMLDLLMFHKWMNQLYLFIIDVFIIFPAYWFTLLIKYFQTKALKTKQD